MSLPVFLVDRTSLSYPLNPVESTKVDPKTVKEKQKIKGNNGDKKYTNTTTTKNNTNNHHQTTTPYTSRTVRKNRRLRIYCSVFLKFKHIPGVQRILSGRGLPKRTGPPRKSRWPSLARAVIRTTTRIVVAITRSLLKTQRSSKKP